MPRTAPNDVARDDFPSLRGRQGLSARFGSAALSPQRAPGCVSVVPNALHNGTIGPSEALRAIPAHSDPWLMRDVDRRRGRLTAVPDGCGSDQITAVPVLS